MRRQMAEEDARRRDGTRRADAGRLRAMAAEAARLVDAEETRRANAETAFKQMSARRP